MDVCKLGKTDVILDIVMNRLSSLSQYLFYFILFYFNYVI